MTDRTGQQLGNYQLVRLLGKGGFAEVYLGQHRFLNQRQVAIKILSTRLSAQDSIDFQREANQLAALKHPHIVPLLDFSVQEEIPYLVMEYCPGGTLRQRHPRGSRLPLSQMVSYIQQVAQALDHAHARRIIHRDVKPENMLIGQSGEIQLSDFGVAAMAHSTSSMSAQAPVGTIPYMAPEQIQAQARPASDQYALGIVAYEWLAASRPFEGSYTEIFAKHLMAPPPPLRAQLPDLPPAVEDVILTALAKDPKNRFASVLAFANALTQAANPASAQPPAQSAFASPRVEAPVAAADATASPVQAPTASTPLAQPVTSPSEIDTPHSLTPNTLAQSVEAPGSIDTSGTLTATQSVEAPGNIDTPGTLTATQSVESLGNLSDPNRQRPGKRTSSIVGVVFLILLLIGGGVFAWLRYATAAATFSANGTFTVVNSTVTSTQQNGQDKTTSWTDQGVFSGDLTGSYTLDGTSIVHPDNTSTFSGTLTCTCTVAGKSGTLRISLTGTGAADGSSQGQSFDYQGTGDLANLHGQGTFQIQGNNGTYSSQLYFDA